MGDCLSQQKYIVYFFVMHSLKLTKHEQLFLKYKVMAHEARHPADTGWDGIINMAGAVVNVSICQQVLLLPWQVQMSTC